MTNAADVVMQKPSAGLLMTRVTYKLLLDGSSGKRKKTTSRLPPPTELDVSFAIMHTKCRYEETRVDSAPATVNNPEGHELDGWMASANTCGPS